jgi:hypothetical protein
MNEETVVRREWREEQSVWSGWVPFSSTSTVVLRGLPGRVQAGSRGHSRCLKQEEHSLGDWLHKWWKSREASQGGQVSHNYLQPVKKKAGRCFQVLGRRSRPWSYDADEAAANSAN